MGLTAVRRWHKEALEAAQAVEGASLPMEPPVEDEGQPRARKRRTVKKDEF